MKLNRNSRSAEVDLWESYRQKLMEVRPLSTSSIVIYAVLVGLALSGQPARGTPLTANLTCVLTGSDSITCDPSSSFGRVTLDDSVGGGQISLTVDVQGIAGKFRDLMLNFDGPGITWVSSGDGQASLVPDGFSLPPYHDGKFDIGGSDQQNWNSTSALYTTLLTGSGPLTLDMFNVTDSQGNLNVALHLQDLATGDSIKVGGIWEGGGGPPEELNPEPGTAALLSGGLIALVWALRRRRAS